MNRISAKYAEKVLVPIEGMSGLKPEPYMTSDGKLCDAIFISFWDNRDGRYDKQLDHICQRYWGLSFSYIKSIWMERCMGIEGYWYFIDLREKK